MTRRFIGFDPGFNGGVAVVENTKVLFSAPMPALKSKSKRYLDVAEIVKIVEDWQTEDTFGVVEQVNPRPGEGVISTASFMKGTGILIGILAAKKIPYEEVRPQKWKQKIISSTDTSKTASINKAKQIFPDINLKPGLKRKDHDGIAEAALIALYGEQTWSQT